MKTFELVNRLNIPEKGLKRKIVFFSLSMFWFNFIDVVFTSQFYYSEINPLVLKSGLLIFTIVKITLMFIFAMAFFFNLEYVKGFDAETD